MTVVLAEGLVASFLGVAAVVSIVVIVFSLVVVRLLLVVVLLFLVVGVGVVSVVVMFAVLYHRGDCRSIAAQGFGN